MTSFEKKTKKLNLVPRRVTFIVMRARTRLFTGPAFHIELRVRPNLFKVDWDEAIWACPADGHFPPPPPAMQACSGVPQRVTETAKQGTFLYPLYLSGMDSCSFRCPRIKL